MEPKGGNEEKEVFGRGMAGGGDGFGQFGERRALQNDGVYVSREEHVVTDDGLGLGKDRRFYGSEGYIVVLCDVFIPGKLRYPVFDFARIGHDKRANTHSNTLCLSDPPQILTNDSRATHHAPKLLFVH